MYTTKNKVNKLTNQYIGGPIFMILGIIIIVSGGGGIFESVGNLIFGGLLIVVGIIQLISSNRKINAIKGHGFNLTESGLEMSIFEEKEMISKTEISSINKTLNNLEIVISSDREDININLENYDLSFDDSKELDDKISSFLSSKSS